MAWVQGVTEMHMGVDVHRLDYTTRGELNTPRVSFKAASRLLWKIEKAYSLGIPKKKLALGESQTEEEHAYGRKYTMFWRNGRSFRT